ncbi:TPA: hypothetical protein ACXE5T_005349, partial [Klebsiella pneumoniae]
MRRRRTGGTRLAGESRKRQSVGGQPAAAGPRGGLLMKTIRTTCPYCGVGCGVLAS